MSNEMCREWNSFKVLIYESEYRQIQAWTAKSPKLETGGDLFGLWLDENTAVVQLVLGPGKGCHRTGASFYQDVEYLERVGNQLTTKEGLCHIGEWHSHHTLGLTRPSGGDENTVWTNMRRYGIHRFCLFIATISRNYKICRVNAFFFQTKRRRLMNKGEFAYIEELSPFRQKLNHMLAIGSQVENLQEDLDSFKSNIDQSISAHGMKESCTIRESRVLYEERHSTSLVINEDQQDRQSYSCNDDTKEQSDINLTQNNLTPSNDQHTNTKGVCNDHLSLYSNPLGAVEGMTSDDLDNNASGCVPEKERNQIADQDQDINNRILEQKPEEDEKITNPHVIL